MSRATEQLNRSASTDWTTAENDHRRDRNLDPGGVHDAWVELRRQAPGFPTYQRCLRTTAVVDVGPDPTERLGAT